MTTERQAQKMRLASGKKCFPISDGSSLKYYSTDVTGYKQLTVHAQNIVSLQEKGRS